MPVELNPEVNQLSQQLQPELDAKARSDLATSHLCLLSRHQQRTAGEAAQAGHIARGGHSGCLALRPAIPVQDTRVGKAGGAQSPQQLSSHRHGCYGCTLFCAMAQRCWAHLGEKAGPGVSQVPHRLDFAFRGQSSFPGDRSSGEGGCPASQATQPGLDFLPDHLISQPGRLGRQCGLT